VTSEEQAAVGAAITRARETRGWTKADLARRVGVNWTTIHRVETGAVEPTLDTLRSLARAMRLSARELKRVVLAR
jgi:ribosome-binding protein aMBF1 (putative translation factor)